MKLNLCFYYIAGWFVIWKAFLSRFSLVREVFGLDKEEADPLPTRQLTLADYQAKARAKARKD